MESVEFATATVVPLIIYSTFAYIKLPQISQITWILLHITATKAAIKCDFTDCFAQLIATLVAVIEIKISS